MADENDEEVFDLSDSFGSNPRASIEGVWVQLGGGAAVKVARLGNKAAKKAYRKIPKASRTAFEEGTVDETTGENFICQFLAQHILKNWKGFADKGTALGDYDEMKGKKFLMKYRRFRERIWELAGDEDLFNVEAEEDAKNLQELSTGTSDTTKTQSRPSNVAS